MKIKDKLLYVYLMTRFIIICVGASFAYTTQARLLSTDNFSGDTSGWADGSSWGGDLTVTTNTSVTPLIYSNAFVYVNGGDTAISVTATVEGTQSKVFGRAIQKQTNTFYMSFLARFNETPTGVYNYLALGQKDPPHDSGVALGRVNDSTTVGCGFMDDGESKQPFSAAPQAGKTFFVVAKYTWDESSSKFTTLTAYLNPTSTVQESAEEIVTVSGTVNADFDSVDVQYYGEADADFDEVRVGLTWADVVPAAPPIPEPVYSVTVTLSPSEAITAGAQWALGSNPSVWMDSADTIELTNGVYIVNFHDASDYETPDDYVLTVNGAAVSYSQAYTEKTPKTTQQTLSVILAYTGTTQCSSQWGIVENNVTKWYDSGKTIELDEGKYHIVYANSYQYIRPSEEDIIITSDTDVVLTRYYTQSQPLDWEESFEAYDISKLGTSQSATNNSGLLAQHFGVYPELQTVEKARLNSNISISDTADVIGSMDRSGRSQDQTWVFDWTSLKPTLHTNTTDWGECDWIGLHTPSAGFDFNNSYSPGADKHPYNSKTDHTDPFGNVSTNDFYPSGGEYYDMEGIYFDNDAEYFYISVISSAPFSNEWVNADGTLCRDLGIPETASARTNAVVPPGDIAFDFGLNDPVSEDGDSFSYDYGIDLTHEVLDQGQWYWINHTYSNSASSTLPFNYKRPPIRDLDAGTGLYRTQNTDWYLALDTYAAISAGSEHTNFDPEDASSKANYKGEVQSSVYRLDFPEGHLENDLPTYVYEFVVPRSLFEGAETNRNYIKVRFLPTTCRNDGNNEEHVFYLNNTSVDEPEPIGCGAIGNRAWFDDNGNGIQDDNENNMGVSDVQVVAVSQSTGAAFTNYTDEFGFYLFENVPAGYYDIYFKGVEDYSLTPYNENAAEPERGHYVLAIAGIWGITNVYVSAGETNLNADVGFKSDTLSTQIDLRAYDSGNGVIIELFTVNENGEGSIKIYAELNGQWQMVAEVPAEQVGGSGSGSYTVAASGLTVGESYKFRIIDETGHIFEPQKTIEVQKNKLKAVKSELTPEYFTITFEADSSSWYEIQYCTSLTANAEWKSEYVQIIHPSLAGGVSSYCLRVMGAPEGQTTVRIPRNHKKVFYRIIKVTAQQDTPQNTL